MVTFLEDFRLQCGNAGPFHIDIISYYNIKFLVFTFAMTIWYFLFILFYVLMIFLFLQVMCCGFYLCMCCTVCFYALVYAGARVHVHTYVNNRGQYEVCSYITFDILVFETKTLKQNLTDRASQAGQWTLKIFICPYTPQLWVYSMHPQPAFTWGLGI